MSQFSYDTYGGHTVRTDVEDWVGEHVEDFDLDGLTNAYRDAINAALPEGIALAGELFYATAYEGHDAEQQIRDAMDSVDLSVIAPQHDISS